MSDGRQAVVYETININYEYKSYIILQTYVCIVSVHVDAGSHVMFRQ